MPPLPAELGRGEPGPAAAAAAAAGDVRYEGGDGEAGRVAGAAAAAAARAAARNEGGVPSGPGITRGCRCTCSAEITTASRWWYLPSSVSGSVRAAPPAAAPQRAVSGQRGVRGRGDPPAPYPT